MRKGILLKCLLVTGLITTVLFASGCAHKGSAVAKCGSVLAGESRLGTVNTPKYAIGSIVGLNPKTKKGFFVSAVTIPNDKKIPSPKESKVSSKYEESLQISFSANIPAETQASLKSYINNSSLLEATNLERVSVKDILSIINADAEVKKAMSNMHVSAGTENIFFVVSSILYADSLGIKLENASNVNADVNVVKVGDFNLSVTYQCADSLKIDGTGFGAFFKITPLGYDDTKGEAFVNSSADIKLSEYDLTNALM